MKRLFLTICLIAGLVGATAIVSATTQTGSVDIGAEIESEGGQPPITPPCIGPDCNPLPPQTILLIESLNVAQNCGSVIISWQAFLQTTVNGQVTAKTPVSATAEIHYRLLPNGAYIATPSSTGNSIAIAGLSVGQSYQYYLHAVSGGYESTLSPSIFTVNCEIPNADLSAVAKNKGIELTVRYPNYPDIAGLVIYRGQTVCPGSVANEFYRDVISKKANDTQTVAGDQNVQLNKPYGYTACIYNSDGVYSSGAYGEAWRHILNVDNFVATPGDKQIALTWKNPGKDTNHDFFFGKVKLIRSNASCSDGGETLAEGAVESYIDNNPSKDANYYKIFVYNSYGESSQGICVNEKGIVGPIPIIEEEKPPEICKDCPSNEHQPEYKFYVNNGALQIFPNNSQLKVLTGYVLKISIARDELVQPVKEVVAQVGNQTYFLAFDSTQRFYEASFMVPAQAGDYPLELSAVYTDNTVARQSLRLNAVGRGFVYTDRRPERKVDEAIVTLYEGDFVYVQFGVTGPQITDREGFYGLMAPNGKYFLEVTKKGFQKYSAPVEIKNNLINLNIELAREQSPLLALFSNLALVLNSPLVDKINTKYAAPFMAAVVSIGFLSSISWWNFWSYLQLLFTEPLAYLTRRKRKGWGVIYNSITKQPIDLAVVRLYDKASDKLLQSRVTDREGRYTFLVPEGEYYLEASKPGFIFPSAILKNLSEDNVFVDLYQGQDIKIAEGHEGAIIANIPLDQEDARQTDRQILRHYFWHGIKKNLSAIGPIFSLVSLIISPSILIGGLTVLHFVLYFLFQRLAEGKKPKSWGVVYDVKNRQPVQKAVARIFAPEYNKMLESQVTDKYGRYGFLAGNNVYYLTADKDGYQQNRTADIDLSRRKSDEVVGQDIALRKLTDELPKIEDKPIEKLGTMTMSAPKILGEKEKSELEEVAEKKNAENSRNA